MLHVLYQIIIQPLVTLTEFFFVLFNEVTDNQGAAVMLLSVAVTLLTLPLYMVAEGWQEKERQIEAALAPRIKRIKDTFTGDERYMMTAAFYREAHYHPIMALRSSFSLAIQVPFFIAAYNFLSNLEPLKGTSFFFIRNMGAPDGIIGLGGIRLNLLPILMTAVNCAAGTVYSHGHPMRERVQIYALALVFLVLLYNSPAGLVLYWTMNNVMSLVKDLCMVGVKSRNRPPAQAGKIAMTDNASSTNHLPLTTCHLPLFLLSAASLAVLAGAVIPSMLVESEPVQFCYVDGIASPFGYITDTLCQAIGLFVLWPVCFFALFGGRVKRSLALIFACAALLAMVDCFLFGLDYGPLDNTLLFMTPQKFSTPRVTATNTAVLILLFIAVIMLIRPCRFPWWPSVSEHFCRPNVHSLGQKCIEATLSVLLMALCAVSFYNLALVNRAYRQMTPPTVADCAESVFHLSRTASNVIVLMQDKLYSPIVMEILADNPEMANRLDGFVNYVNCVSPAHLTMLGVPGIFGGYDYTPYYMNYMDEQKDKTLQQKHNEAILSMPVLFHNEGWRVAVADMPYENYLDYPTERAYDGYPFVERVTTRGVYSPLWYHRHGMQKVPYSSTHIKRNMLWFSLFKMSPPAMRRFIYHGEYWLSWDGTRKLSRFIDNYSEIDLLPEIVGIDDEGSSFMLLDNEATHECVMLEPPDYVPSDKKDSDSANHTNELKISPIRKLKHKPVTGKKVWAHTEQYTSTAGILLRLADFFDWMKANGVYDNTRIIIVSDHGNGVDTGVFYPNYLGCDSNGKAYGRTDFVASLFVKDFDSRGLLKTSMEFMTNADVPAIAAHGIIEDARSPFTHTPFQLTENEKEARLRLVLAPAESTRIRHNTQFKIADSEWWTVRDDIYKEENWERLRRSDSRQ